jgi:hypothetical protein
MCSSAEACSQIVVQWPSRASKVAGSATMPPGVAITAWACRRSVSSSARRS